MYKPKCEFGGPSVNDHDQFFKWTMDANLGLQAQFHDYLKKALGEKAREIELDEGLDKGNKEYWRLNYQEHFPKKLRETTFLLMFGHLEEVLYLLSKSFNPYEIALAKNKSGILKFKPYIKSVLGEELSSSQDYQFIREAQVVRNSMLHIAGRISLSQDREGLEGLLKSRPNFYKASNDRITITVEGLKRFHDAVQGLTNNLVDMSRKQGV